MAFDEGVKLPPSRRDRERLSHTGKTISYGPRFFVVRCDRPVFLNELRHFLTQVRDESADLEHSGEYQVTTFIGEGYVAAVTSSVLESELGVQYRDDITCFWRIGTLRRI
jgi:hypothetical protein